MFPSRRLTALLVVLAVSVGMLVWRASLRRTIANRPEAQAEKAARAYLELEAREQDVAVSLWAPELDAERHEDEILRHWDALNRSADSWQTLGQLPVRQVSLPLVEARPSLPDGIQFWKLSPPKSGRAEELTSGALSSWLKAWEKSGWTLGKTTWALIAHQPSQTPSPARSRLLVTAQCENVPAAERAMLSF